MSDAYARVRRLGVRAVSPSDLLNLGAARRAEDVGHGEAAAQRLWTRFGGVQRLHDLSPVDLKAAFGLDEFEAARLLALLELGRRSASAAKGERDGIDSPEDAARLFLDLRQERQEHFAAVYLDAKGGVLETRTVHIGTVESSLVSPRDVFRPAIRVGASSVIVAHNHPSGDPSPSPEDFAITRILTDAGRLLDVILDDHLVIGDPFVHSIGGNRRFHA